MMGPKGGGAEKSELATLLEVLANPKTAKKQLEEFEATKADAIKYAGNKAKLEQADKLFADAEVEFKQATQTLAIAKNKAKSIEADAIKYSDMVRGSADDYAATLKAKADSEMEEWGRLRESWASRESELKAEEVALEQKQREWEDKIAAAKATEDLFKEKLEKIKQLA